MSLFWLMTSGFLEKIELRLVTDQFEENYRRLVNKLY